MAADVHVGARMRLRRRFLGMSQQAVAETLGLTFQQVQKYERGANRISASKLYDIAGILGVEVSYFFEGLPDSAEPRDPDSEAGRQEKAVLDFLTTEEGIELAAAFPKIRQPRLRRRLLDLIRSLTQPDEADD